MADTVSRDPICPRCGAPESVHAVVDCDWLAEVRGLAGPAHSLPDAGPPRTFPALVAAELARARAAHRTPINSPHEGYALILEEIQEFWEEVRRKRHERDPDRLRAELVQVATLCQRLAEDRDLVP